MPKVIAIHPEPKSFSARWIELCAERKIPVREVNAFDSDIIHQLADARAFLWHFHHVLPADLAAAPRVLHAAEMMGLAVFPNQTTSWHFDDKIAQKYMLEALGAPLVRTYVFYSEEDAGRWIDAAEFPKVFKLSRGAGSANVRLVRTRDEARRLVGQAFGKGFKPVASVFADAPLRLARARGGSDLLKKLARGPAVLSQYWRTRYAMQRERGYAYFQDFLAGNAFDTRITVIGNRAFGFTRNVRKDDFRASGSGSISYDLGRVDERCLRIAFDVARKTVSQSMAFDFLKGPDGAPQINEVSYGYQALAVYNCVGHWDERLAWHDGHMWPQDAILDDLLAGLA